MNNKFPSEKNYTGRNFGDEEINLLTEVIKKGTLNSTHGYFVKKFEEEFSKLHSISFGIAASSCTAAIHSALFALGIKKGDEVITSPVTDFGAITPIVWLQGIPVFCDLDPNTLLPTPETIKKRITKKTKAIIVTHLFGQMCDVEAIKMVAKDIPIIEDCAQAPLAMFNNKYAGTIGEISVFSFQQGKHITCGEGGICLVRDSNLARRIRLFVNKGWPYGEKEPDHEFIALNYRMTELQGAVLCAQIKKLEYSIKIRRENAKAFKEMIKVIDGVEPLPEPSSMVHSYWRFPVIVDETIVPGGAKALGNFLLERRVPCQPNYVGKPAFELKAIKEDDLFGLSKLITTKKEEFPGTYEGLKRILVFPWNENYKLEHIEKIVKELKKGINYLKAGT